MQIRKILIVLGMNLHQSALLMPDILYHVAWTTATHCSVSCVTAAEGYAVCTENAATDGDRSLVLRYVIVRYVLTPSQDLAGQAD